VIPDPPEGYEWGRVQDVKDDDEVLSASGDFRIWACEGFTMQRVTLVAVRVPVEEVE
jgi:hypothetical protein